jgi:hypothetical protein
MLNFILPRSRVGFSLVLHGLEAGFACFQTQISPAKSRVLLFDVTKIAA